jgi:hypothetical protein
MAQVSTQRYIRGLGKAGDAVKILLDVDRLVRREAMVGLSAAGLSQAAVLA